MATCREILNKVLRGLRQEPIATGTTSTTDTYELLLLQFVNEAKEEIEEAWDWYALRQTITVTLSAGVSEYDLTVAGAADVDTNERTRLLYDKGRAYGGSSETSARGSASTPQVFDVTDSTEYRLIEAPYERIERLHMTDNDEQERPQYFALYADSDSVKMKVYPTPSASRTLKMRFVIPQTELESTALSTTLTIPSRPVWTLALFKANEERGSELGRPGSSLYVAYLDALSAAMDREMTSDDKTSYPE